MAQSKWPEFSSSNHSLRCMLIGLAMLLAHVPQTQCQKIVARPDIPRAFVTLNKHEPGVVVSINEGGRAEFECTALVNPKPTYHWTLQPENTLIPPYRAVFSANQRRVMVFDIMEKMCVRCLAVSSLGNATATRCVEVLKNCSTPDRASSQTQRHGTGWREHSRGNSDMLDNADGQSACFIFVVDESHNSMQTYHRWLQEANLGRRLDVDLLRRNVGVFRRTRYCIVSFDSDQEGGHVWQVGARESCGTADEFDQAVDGLKAIGRWDDSYGSISLALDSLPCVKKSAVQIILITDQERPNLADAPNVKQMIQKLAEHNVIVNTLVRYPIAASSTHRALGMESDGSVILPSRQRRINNASLSDTVSRRRIFQDYVMLARLSGGSVFDLDMLGVESLADVARKDILVLDLAARTVQQLTSTCSQCSCDNSTVQCIPVSSTVRLYCEQPVESASVRATVVPGQALLARGSQIELHCVTHGVAPILVTWQPHSLNAVASRNGSLMLYDFQRRDIGKYVCTARGSQGYATSTAELEMDLLCEQPPIPAAGYLQPSSRRYSIGSSVDVYCNYGHARVGYKRLRCQPNGQWSLPSPKCEPVACSRPSAFPNGRIRGKVYTYGMSIRYECDDGYRLAGVSERRC
eukprot:scpid40865/ scgid4475/ Sushi, von Willebrand factor type A, EGF and pentraxin domain-containing protein 1